MALTECPNLVNRCPSSPVKKVALVHFLPLEYYPPATNLLEYLADTGRHDVAALSTHNPLGRQQFQRHGVRVWRATFPHQGLTRLGRVLAHLHFNLGATRQLQMMKPDTVIYMEPHSAFPPFVYRKLHPHSRLCIHYHEYHEPSEFKQPGMRLPGLLHRLEKRWLYSVAEWISQTNEQRVDFFGKDFPAIPREILHVLPNLPPPSWATRARDPSENPTTPLRIVYVGCLGLEDYHLDSFLEWVRGENGKVNLDIYAYGLNEETTERLAREESSGVISFRGEILYSKLPEVLPQYDVGVILHRGTTPNYIHNAPNKLFEYLACGLDVWYPNDMVGCSHYQGETCLPKVVELDFQHLERLNATDTTQRNGNERLRHLMTYDQVLPELEQVT